MGILSMLVNVVACFLQTWDYLLLIGLINNIIHCKSSNNANDLIFNQISKVMSVKVLTFELLDNPYSAQDVTV